jgi:hypothetical protein
MASILPFIRPRGDFDEQTTRLMGEAFNAAVTWVAEDIFDAMGRAFSALAGAPPLTATRSRRPVPIKNKPPAFGPRSGADSNSPMSISRMSRGRRSAAKMLTKVRRGGSSINIAKLPNYGWAWKATSRA